MNFSTATHAELSQDGYTVKVLRSQTASRRRKSLFGVRPSMNSSANHSVKPLKAADEVGTGKMQG